MHPDVHSHAMSNAKKGAQTWTKEGLSWTKEGLHEVQVPCTCLSRDLYKSENFALKSNDNIK